METHACVSPCGARYCPRYIPLIYILKTQWQFEEKKEINTELIVYKYSKKNHMSIPFLKRTDLFIIVWIYFISVGFGLAGV